MSMSKKESQLYVQHSNAVTFVAISSCTLALFGLPWLAVTAFEPGLLIFPILIVLSIVTGGFLLWNGRATVMPWVMVVGFLYLPLVLAFFS